eukprot:TRINITY_DN10773_c0_g1_i1.p2 TRINITY_DN10773_c0_g1~~TRINITY_DN10773_c0_g1_i1.p2  ORF type:complete len:133 (+),score=6.71 TRINITY_DN10773_c0_g1_i1:478-876(+)
MAVAMSGIRGFRILGGDFLPLYQIPRVFSPSFSALALVAPYAPGSFCFSFPSVSCDDPFSSPLVSSSGFSSLPSASVSVGFTGRSIFLRFNFLLFLFSLRLRFIIPSHPSLRRRAHAGRGCERHAVTHERRR